MIAVKKWHSMLLYAFFGKCKRLCVTVHVFLCFIILNLRAISEHKPPGAQTYNLTEVPSFDNPIKVRGPELQTFSK